MKNLIILFIVSILFSMPFTVFAQETTESIQPPGIVMLLEKTKYLPTDDLLVRIVTIQIPIGTEILLTVHDPQKTKIFSNTTRIIDNNGFKINIPHKDDQWKYNGKYTISIVVKTLNLDSSKEITMLGNIETHNAYTLPEVLFQQLVPDIIIRIDKTDYKNGDKIMVSGEIKQRFGRMPVNLFITNEGGELISSQKAYPTLDNNYTFEFLAGNGHMKKKGLYTLTAQYGAEFRSTNTSFTFDGVPENIFVGSNIHLNAQDRKQFELYLNFWNGYVLNLERNAEREEFLGNLAESQKLKFQARIYESLINHLENLI